MKKITSIALWGACLLGLSTLQAQQLHTHHPLLDSAFRLAVWTVDHNTHNGIIEAGAGYGGEWTRDASINCYNAVSLLRPKVAEKSLWSVTEERKRIGHQYWDKIIWTLAAWRHYQVTGDSSFLREAYSCAALTMRELENQCYNGEKGLFMGPALFQDGIEAYPEPVYDPSKWDDSFVLHHPHSDSICCLSSNVVYSMAYHDLGEMARVLGRQDEQQRYRSLHDQLQQHIRKYFYDSLHHRLDYLIDHQGKLHQYQEGIGVSLALASGLLPPDEARSTLHRLRLTPYGLPSVSPSFPRNSPSKPGRHNMMIWPHINAFYAMACASLGEQQEFYREVENLARLAIENGRGIFYEIYTIDGEPSGGWQCKALWDKKEHQTWCATGYLRLWTEGIFGMHFEGGRLLLEPMGTADGSECRLEGIRWRNTELSITLRGKGRHQRTRINGVEVSEAAIKPTGGKVLVEIELFGK